MKKPMPPKAGKFKMRMGAPVAKAAAGGFLGGAADGLSMGFKAGQNAKERKDKRAEKKDAERMSREGIYKRGGMVKKGKK